jgi:hypothetical protein
MNKSKINKYKINNNNKTNTKHEFNVKYERYKQDISKDTLQMQKKVKKKKPTFWQKHVSLSCLHFSHMLRQLKNNQNQTNTTGAQNLKELNNTAGWLSVFFVVFFWLWIN